MPITSKRVLQLRGYSGSNGCSFQCDGVKMRCDYRILEAGDSIFMKLRMREHVN